MEIMMLVVVVVVVVEVVVMMNALFYWAYSTSFLLFSYRFFNH
jgi:hypothetical protein